MRQIKLTATISSDHKLTANAPADVPAGITEIIVLAPDHAAIQRPRSLKEFLTRLHKADIPGRSKEEIDHYIDAERLAWERDDGRDLSR